MSYDLYFTNPRISREQFTEYFSGRPSYEVSDSEAVYQNKDTGVYFVFSWSEGEEEDPEAIPFTACLNLNYFRPHAFGLECLEEVAAFVKGFGFSVYDPQNEGMGGGLFDMEGFLKGWNCGNEFAYSAILKGENSPERLFVMPGKHLESVWRWNSQKRAVQDSYSEDRFVPGVFFMEIVGEVATVAVWPEAISELVPHVDYLIVGRDELAPQPLFGSRRPDQIIVPIGDIEADLAAFRTSDYALPTYKLPAPCTPKPIRHRVRKLKQTGLSAERIRFDQILNEEIVEKYRKL